MGVTAIAKMSRPSGRGFGFLRCCLAGACLTVVIAAASPGTAGAVVPRLGRWSGSGPGGEIQFAVSRVGGTLVLSNLVISCSTGAAAAGYDDEEALERNGRIYSYSFPADLSGKLGLGSGTVTASGNVAQLSGCGSAGLRDVRVAPSGARVVRDGTYSITGLLGTYGTASVYGDGALLEYTASFATPVGAVGDNPEGCAEEAVAATSSANPVLPAADGSFSAHTITALGFVAEASLSGQFTSARSAVGTYSATFVDGDVVDCAGDGPFALALVHPAPALEPVRAPKPGPPGPTAPSRPHRCAMRFQIQQGSSTPHSWPILSPHSITVAEALAGLDALESQTSHRMRKASKPAFKDTRKWVIARPQHGGVSATGNVKRVWFVHAKKRWRLDTENLRCRNLTS